MNHERPASVQGARVVLDVGFGETAITTQEWRAAINDPAVRVVGVERVLPVGPPPPGVEWVAGGFDVVASLGPASVVRALNVLRGYREDEVEPARTALRAALAPDGLLLEGSSDTDGHVLVVWVETAGTRELLCFTDFTRGFSPWLFRDWLPRDLRRSVKPGTWIFDALSRWNARIEASGAQHPRSRFDASWGDDVVATPWERAHGYVRLVPPG